ncbi:MAG: hypothetical protein AAFX78_03625 [Cyanobacteria bacterium J06638_20]
MGINLSGRKLRVLIGADSQDWSPCAGRFVPGRESLGEDGTLATTATLEILENHLNPESIDPDVNPARWRPGQLVKVQVATGSGVFVDHPLGHLYILTEPAYDDEAEILPLDLGDWLAWGDTQEPADDVSAITLGTAEDTSVIAQRYLEAADIPAASINLGGPWGYSVALPVTKPTGSYVQKAGELAYASGFRVLYQDKAGIVRSQVVTTTAKVTPDLTLDLNTQNLRFDRYRDGQEPFEVIRVAGTGEAVSAVSTPITDTQSDTDTETFTSESYDVDEDQIITRGAVVSVNPDRTASRTSRFRFKQVGSQVFEASESNTKVVVDDTTEILYYEVPTGEPDNSWPRRFFRSFTYTEKAVGLIDGGEAATTERTREVEVLLTFDADGRVSQSVEKEWAREKEFDPGSNFPIQWRQIRERVETWERKGTGLYAYLGIEKVARITATTSAGTLGGNKWQLVQNRPADIRPAKARGENEPPSAEEWEGPFTAAQQDYQGEVTWVHRGGATGRSRTRTFLLPQGLAFSVAQCEALSTIHRDLLAGRQRGRLIQLALSDALLALDTPLPQLEVLCLDGWTRTYLMDSPTWEHQSDRAFCETVGILIKEVAP